MTASADSRAFVDTNILVYCYDKDDPSKHERAKDLVRALVRSHRIVLSAQVLNEFFVAITRQRRDEPMMPTRAKRIVEHYISMCRIVPLAASTTQLALTAIFRHNISFWDALIWAAAKEHAIPVVYTEDFQHDRDIDGVHFINPFIVPA